jgi:hypothetical protein
MYMLLTRKRKGKKQWKMIYFAKTVHYAKNGLVRTHGDAIFLADVFKNEVYDTKVVKV